MIMGKTLMEKVTGMNLFKNSSLHTILRAERDEINKLKWIESEKAHHDIGINRARMIWSRYRVQWLNWFRGQIKRN